MYKLNILEGDYIYEQNSKRIIKGSKRINSG